MNQSNRLKKWRKASLGIWCGRFLSTIFITFMLTASVLPKFLFPEMAIPTLEQLGWPAKYLLLIGTIELVGTLLYSYSKTAIIGAILLTGLLGGALAAQLRVEAALFTHVLFSLYLGIFMWGGLWLRNPRLRTIINSFKE
ncbi:MAG: DoxX family protein [Candidatus Pacebacteria bacterium]|nr:DoxX family protein [Candidatus Paceibacterota bacterium]